MKVQNCEIEIVKTHYIGYIGYIHAYCLQLFLSLSLLTLSKGIVGQGGGGGMVDYHHHKQAGWHKLWQAGIKAACEDFL